MFSSRKHLYMWLSVAGTTLAIGLIWAASVKYDIAASIGNLKNAKSDTWDTLSVFRDGFNKDLSGLKELLNQTVITTSTTSTP